MVWLWTTVNFQNVNCFYHDIESLYNWNVVNGLAIYNIIFVKSLHSSEKAQLLSFLNIAQLDLSQKTKFEGI